MKSFIAVTYHNVNEDFQLVSGILDFVNSLGNHDGNHCIDPENVSNYTTMLKELISVAFISSAEQRIRCFV